MNKNGFTLVELLAVIIVMGLIAVIALPQVLTQFTNTSGDLSEKQKELIREGARTYIKHNINNYTDESQTYCIKVSDIINAGYLDENATNNISGGSSYSVKAKYENKSVKIIDIYSKENCTND